MVSVSLFISSFFFAPYMFILKAFLSPFVMAQSIFKALSLTYFRQFFFVLSFTIFSASRTFFLATVIVIHEKFSSMNQKGNEIGDNDETTYIHINIHMHTNTVWHTLTYTAWVKCEKSRYFHFHWNEIHLTWHIHFRRRQILSTSFVSFKPNIPSSVCRCDVSQYLGYHASI